MLDEVKRALAITWEDEGIDLRINELIKQSQSAIDELLGVEIDYTSNLIAKELMINRIRYAYNNALEYFETNFQKEILRLQLMIGVQNVK